MKTPLVSAIIPNYNYSQYLREAIESVLGQTYSKLEIIVVDDGSEDNSRQIIKSYADKIKPIFQQNQGVAAARNRGVAESNGEYIAFLDADDAWLPEKIEKQVELLISNPELGLVYVNVMEIDGEGREINERSDGLSGWVGKDLLLFERPVVLGGGSGVMIPRTVFDQVSGFDPQMSTSADWDLYFRIGSRFPVDFVSEKLLRYRIHNSNMHGNIAVMEHDMVLGFEKAFSSGAVAPRRECYGNLHKTLAGSYFNAGKYRDFVRHTVLSVWNRPSHIAYFVQFPVRRIRKK